MAFGREIRGSASPLGRTLLAAASFMKNDGHRYFINEESKRRKIKKM